MEELWYKVEGYDYFVSNYGEVMNKDGKIKKIKNR